jgi:hypothetical protein
MDQAIEFTAPVLRADGPSGGAYIEFPFDPAESFGKSGRVRVVCAFDGVEYRGSLVKMGGRYVIGVLKEILGSLGKGYGDSLAVAVREDSEDRLVAPHPDLAALLSDDPVAQTAWESLSYSQRKKLNDGLVDAKQERTRQSRLDKIRAELAG